MKIFLVTKCPFIRQRLTDLLEEDRRYVVVGFADTFDAAIEANIVREQPDIAMLDIELKQGNGSEALAEAKRRLPELLGIVVSNRLTARHRKAAINAVAACLLDKAAAIERRAVTVEQS
jgi:DNA-binding NarL/FixJ family response regulator